MSRELSLLVLSYAGRALCLLAAAFALYSAHCRIREGAINLYGSAVEKDKYPITFWAIIAVALVGIGCLIYVGLGQSAL
jgi:hypothetical protein